MVDCFLQALAPYAEEKPMVNLLYDISLVTHLREVILGDLKVCCV